MQSDSIKFVEQLFKKKKDQIGKKEMIDLIYNQYQAIGRLGLDLYCANPENHIFKSYPKEMLYEWQAERQRRLDISVEKLIKTLD
jgi:hypothetical protein